MGIGKSRIQSKFNQHIEEFKGDEYKPIVLTDITSEYVDLLFEKFQRKNNEEKQIVKIMVLGKTGNGKSHIINCILKKVVAQANAGFDAGTIRPTEFKIIKENIELSFIDVDGYGEGIEYLNYKEKIKALIYIHRPSIIWYVRESRDIRMSKNEQKEFLVFKELKVSVIFIANRIDREESEEIHNQWRANFERIDGTIQTFIGFPRLKLNQLDENADIESLVDVTLRYAIDINEMIKNEKSSNKNRM